MFRVYPACAEPRSEPQGANPARSLYPEERRVYPACPVYASCPVCAEPRTERTRRARPTFPARSTPILSSSHLCALCASAFSSPNVDAHDAASSISPLSAILTKNTRGWVSVPIVNPIVQFNCRFISNSHRIIFFAHPHLLTPIESYSCKKQGRGYPPCGTDFQSVSPFVSDLDAFLTSLSHHPVTSAPTRRAMPVYSEPCARGNFNIFTTLLHNSRTPQGVCSQRREVQFSRDFHGTRARSAGHGILATEFGSRDTGRGTRVTASHSLSTP